MARPFPENGRIRARSRRWDEAFRASYSKRLARMEKVGKKGMVSIFAMICLSL